MSDCSFFNAMPPEKRAEIYKQVSEEHRKETEMIAELEIKLLSQIGDGPLTRIGTITVPISANIEDETITLTIPKIQLTKEMR